jgi:NitT/TauT family transport system permease protein
VRLPASLPFIIAALKIAAPASVLGATVGEWLGTAGIGYLLFSSMANFQVPLLWATMLVAAAVAAAGYLIFAGVEGLAGAAPPPQAASVRTAVRAAGTSV